MYKKCKFFKYKLKPTSLFSGNTSKIDININPEKNLLISLLQNVDFGEYKIFNRKGKTKGEKVETSFNFKYLIDGISNIEDSNVVFELNGDDGPALLKSVNNDNYVYILMPIKA